ncbi:hypothetical protein ACTS9T_09835 [Empedobacter falsenii]|uniref:hypothetical protein n=1 Tax=Empedobacter sp. GD03797 TaxID=2975382 RepID=UPI002446C8E4|nr:hypothetical protein [Empedobacter sp. GD03797]MDH1883689.1 hypothetical protein [Empedobacter sp. GD03797]
MKSFYLILLGCFVFNSCIEDENILIDTPNRSERITPSLKDNIKDSTSSKNDPPRDKDPYMRRKDDEKGD